MAGTDTRQLLLQVDASVAVAQRNLQQLARQVANDSAGMDQALSRVDKAFSRVNRSAEESAKAFIDGRRGAENLIASIDPLYAAQLRYNRALEEAQVELKRGTLDAQEFARVQTGLKAQLDQQVGGFGRVAGASGNLRAGMNQLSFQIGDVAQGFALGVKPMTIFAQQGGQVIQTLQIMGGGTNKFLQILSGPWGIALQLATSALLLLSMRHKDTAETVNSLVEKMQKEADQARLNEQANKIWANSLDGVREAQKKLRDEINESIRVQQIQNQQNLDRVREELEQRKRELAQAEQELARRQQALSNARNSPALTPEDDAAREVLLTRLNKRFDEQKQKVKDLTDAIRENEQTIRSAAIPVARDYASAVTDASQAVGGFYDVARGRIELAARDSDALADHLTTIETALEKARSASEDAASAGINFGSTARQVQALTQSLVAGKIGPDAYTKSVNALAKALSAAAKAAQDAKKSTADANRQFGRQIDFAQAESIARNAGLQVNSGYRSNAQQAVLYNNPAVNRPGNPVAPPGASAHNGANGKWAIDIQITDGVTPGRIRKIFADQGVSLTKVLKEKGHFHVEGSRSEAAAAEKSQASEQARQVRNDNGYEEQLDRLGRQLLAAQMDLVEGTEQRADYARILAEKDKEDADRAIQNDVEEGKLTQAQADALKAKTEEIKQQRLKNIEIQKQIATIRDEDAAAEQDAGIRQRNLEFQDSIAKTAAEHRQIQLEILDLVYEEKRKHLEYLKAQAELVNNTAEAARLQQQINDLPVAKAQDQRHVNDNTKGPLDQWRDSVPQTAAEISEALQSIEVEGLNGLVNGLASVVAGTQSMGEAFHAVAQQIIAEITAMIIKMLVFKAIQAATGGGGGFGGGLSMGGLDFGSSFGSVPAEGGGLGGGLALGGLSFGASFRATGGPVTAGKPYIVGEKRPELFVPNSNGFILPSVPKVGVPNAANSNMRSGDTFHVNVSVPGAMGDRDARRTGAQIAAGFQSQIAKSRSKGIAA